MKRRHNAGKSIVAVFFAVAVLSLIVFSSSNADASNQPVTLLCPDGTTVYDSPLVDGSSVAFNTYLDGNGKVHYRLSKDTKLNTSEVRLMVSGGMDSIYVKISVENISGYLSLTGVKIGLVNGISNPSAVLNSSNGYSDYLRDELGNMQAIRPGVLYELDVFTANIYDSLTVPRGFDGVSFTFECYSEPAAPSGWCNLQFYFEGDLIETRQVPADGIIGDPLPYVAKSGYEFIGWFNGDEPISGNTNVRDLKSYRIDAVLDPTSEPIQWPKHTEIRTTKVNDNGQNVVTIITVDEYEDGNKHKVATARTYEADAMIGLERVMTWASPEGTCQAKADYVDSRAYVSFPSTDARLVG